MDSPSRSVGEKWVIHPMAATGPPPRVPPRTLHRKGGVEFETAGTLPAARWPGWTGDAGCGAHPRLGGIPLRVQGLVGPYAPQVLRRTRSQFSWAMARRVWSS